jgi:hypothetical protein
MYEENLKGTVSLQFVTWFFSIYHLPTDYFISSISIYFQKFMKGHQAVKLYQISFSRFTLIAETPKANLLSVSTMP